MAPWVTAFAVVERWSEVGSAAAMSKARYRLECLSPQYWDSVRGSGIGESFGFAGCQPT